MISNARSGLNTRGGKLLAFLWFLIPNVVVGISIYGWSIGDISGGILLSFLPVSLLTVIAVVLSLIIEKPISKFSRWVWLAVSLAALFAAILFANRSIPDAIKGADTILVYIMLILSFPSALLVPLVLMAIAPLLWGSGSGLVGLSGMWFLFVIAGYLQWFVLLPWLWRKWKARNT